MCVRCLYVLCFVCICDLCVCVCACVCVGSAQAHDKRVMKVVKQLNGEHYDKMKYYLTKVR